MMYWFQLLHSLMILPINGEMFEFLKNFNYKPSQCCLNTKNNKCYRPITVCNILRSDIPLKNKYCDQSWKLSESHPCLHSNEISGEFDQSNIELVSFNPLNEAELLSKMKWKAKDDRLKFLDGIWWMKGNPMPEELVAFGDCTLDQNESFNLDFYGPGEFTATSELYGFGMKLARTTVSFKPIDVTTNKFYYNNCEKRTYEEAKTYCEDIGMKIASFSSDADVIVAHEMKRCDSYVGATRQKDGTWMWEDGTEWKKLNVDLSEGRNLGSSNKKDTNLDKKPTKLVWIDDSLHARGIGEERLGVLCQSELPKDKSCVEYCTYSADCRSVKCDKPSIMETKTKCCCSVREKDDEPCGGVDTVEADDGLKRMMWRLFPDSNGPAFWKFTGGLSLGEGSPINEYYLTYISDDWYQRGIKMNGSWKFSYDLVRIVDQEGHKTKYWNEFEQYWTNTWFGKSQMYTYQSKLKLQKEKEDVVMLNENEFLY